MENQGQFMLDSNQPLLLQINHTKTILVVEDNVGNFMLIARMH